MSNNIFKLITSEENIYKAYLQTQKSKGKYKKQAMVFALNETYNLKILRDSLINGTYEFGEYTRFTVYEPKERIVDAPTYIDKIVQIAINNVLKEIYYPCFIHDSYSCIDEKGTHACAIRIQKFIKRAKWKYGDEAYIVKIDVKKFFYSINRETLKEILPKKIKCEKTLELLYKIIDSADDISLLGLPLGNTLSQIGANIYMNEVDQFAKRKLGIKFYARYADDIIIAVKNKEEAIAIRDEVTGFIEEKLKLEANKNKTKIFPINQGVNAIGYKIYATHMLLRNDCKKKIKRKAKKMRRLLIKKKIKKEKAEQILNSWKGHAEYANSYNFIQSLIERFDYIELIGDKLKVNIQIIEKERENADQKK